MTAPIELRLQTFTNSQIKTPLRIIERSDGIVLFLGIDVAFLLGYQKHSKMYERLDDDDKILLTPHSWKDVKLKSEKGKNTGVSSDLELSSKEFELSLSQKEIIANENFDKILKCFGLSKNTPRLVFINESGLYNAIFNSRKEYATNFKKWVTSKILPEIRKTGSFNSKQIGLNLTLEEYITLYNKLKQEYMSLSKKYQAKSIKIVELERKIDKLKKVILEIL